MNPIAPRTAFAYLGAAFVLGAVAGGAGGYLTARRTHPAAPTRDQIVHHVGNRLARQLGLTAEQRAKIDPLIAEGVDAVRRSDDEHFREVRDLVRQNHQRMLPMLSAGQGRRLCELDAQRARDPKSEKSPAPNPAAPAPRPPP